jgi:hypothetical protein
MNLYTPAYAVGGLGCRHFAETHASEAGALANSRLSLLIGLSGRQCSGTGARKLCQRRLLRAHLHPPFRSGIQTLLPRQRELLSENLESFRRFLRREGILLFLLKRRTRVGRVKTSRRVVGDRVLLQAFDLRPPIRLTISCCRN